MLVSTAAIVVVVVVVLLWLKRDGIWTPLFKYIISRVALRLDKILMMQYQEEKQVFEELCQEMKIKNENLQGGGKWKIVNWDGVQKLLFLDNI